MFSLQWQHLLLQTVCWNICLTHDGLMHSKCQIHSKINFSCSSPPFQLKNQASFFFTTARRRWSLMRGRRKLFNLKTSLPLALVSEADAAKALLLWKRNQVSGFKYDDLPCHLLKWLFVDFRWKCCYQTAFAFFFFTSPHQKYMSLPITDMTRFLPTKYGGCHTFSDDDLTS